MNQFSMHWGELFTSESPGLTECPERREHCNRGNVPIYPDTGSGLMPNLEYILKRLALEELTPREQDVLILILRGLPNKLIAHELGISYETVKVHCRRIRAKYGVNTRSELFARVLEKALLFSSANVWVPGRP